MHQSRVAGQHGTAYGPVQGCLHVGAVRPPAAASAASSVLAGLSAGTKTRADAVAERLAARA